MPLESIDVNNLSKLQNCGMDDHVLLTMPVPVDLAARLKEASDVSNASVEELVTFCILQSLPRARSALGMHCDSLDNDYEPTP